MKNILKVEGMSCDHCVKRITKAIGDINGIKMVEVSLPNQTVKVEYEGNLYSTIEKSIKEMGYKIEE